MKKLLSAVSASALAATMALTGVAPAMAAPVAVPLAIEAPSDVVQVQERRLRRLENREDRIERRERRVERRIDRLEDQDNLSPRERRRLNRLQNREERLDRREARVERRQDRVRDRLERRGDDYYYRGYRGYRTYRPGYRVYDGYYFPAAAFIAGALITGAIASQPRTVIIEGSFSQAHVDWCYNRYRSYRASDNSFVTYSGNRQKCYSPYD